MLIVMAASSSLLRMEQIPGKGRGLVASQPLKAGQIVLTESPLILYSASPLLTPSSSPYTYCDHCFRILPLTHNSTTVTCPSCSNHSFCSQKCFSLALKSSHSTWVCKALMSLQQHPNSTLLQQHPQERQVQARLIVASHKLFLHNHTPSELDTFLSLHGTPDDAILDAANFLHSLISPLFPPQAQLSVDLIAQLLAKDRLNSFGLMDPYSPDGPQRSIKAYAIYPKATFFNHDCVPNACRFDYVDSTNDDYERNSTDIVIRLIEDVDEGKEVCISYFRIGRDYCTRKRILMEDYGFTCGCDRCKIEANWDGEENNSDLPHVRFLSKYVCERKNCAGTMAPLPPKDDVPSNVLECNFCGNFKIDAA
ncbi:SET domain-containing protein [Glycine max]|uniref:SET domain-containing protein n=1 Tax=Glycine max TaxID=3847 RepID=UPI000B518153|nr:SET domain-containing protein [Glycine max]|eukprot:NP_001304443.2 SET domain-containing protein [Glycine max]